MKNLLAITLILITNSSYSSTEGDYNLEDYFFNVVFLNNLDLSKEASNYCSLNMESFTISEKKICHIFSILDGKEVMTMYSPDEIQKTMKIDESIFSSYSDEDYSRHFINVVSKSGDSFTALVNTGLFVSTANVSPNLEKSDIIYEKTNNIKSNLGLALLDIQTNISGLENKIFLTNEESIGNISIDYLIQFSRFSFYPHGISFHDEDKMCDENCISYDLIFDGENIYFNYPVDNKKVPFHINTASPISTTPNIETGKCIEENINNIKEYTIGIEKSSKLCLTDFKFGNHNLTRYAISDAGKMIENQRSYTMGMNLINFLDHIYFDFINMKLNLYFNE